MEAAVLSSAVCFGQACESQHQKSCGLHPPVSLPSLGILFSAVAMHTERSVAHLAAAATPWCQVQTLVPLRHHQPFAAAMGLGSQQFVALVACRAYFLRDLGQRRAWIHQTAPAAIEGLIAGLAQKGLCGQSAQRGPVGASEQEVEKRIVD